MTAAFSIQYDSDTDLWCLHHGTDCLIGTPDLTTAGSMLRVMEGHQQPVGVLDHTALAIAKMRAA